MVDDRSKGSRVDFFFVGINNVRLSSECLDLRRIAACAKFERFVPSAGGS